MRFLFTFLIHEDLGLQSHMCLLNVPFMASAIPLWDFLYLSDQLNNMTTETEACDPACQAVSSIY